MNYSESYGQGYAFPFINRVREALIAEVVAINGYNKHIADSNMDEINNVWKDIIKEEKEHYGLFLSLIHKYDPTEYQFYLRYANDTTPVTAMQAYEPKYDKQIILNNVRDDIKGELEAIILYEQLVLEESHNDIKETFNKVIRDEKEHVEQLTRLLLKYDPDKYNNLK